MNSHTQRKVTAWVLWQVVARTFFLQTLWNFQRMQNAGFAFALEPALRAIYKDEAARRRALRRHLDFFVTQPYFASLILGVVIRLEEAAAARGETDAPEASRVKISMMGPLAAMGDTLFWATLRPVFALLGASVVLLSGAVRVWPAMWGPIVFLTGYSSAHLAMRIGGVFAGYHRGLGIIQDLRQINPQRISHRISLYSAILGGAVTAGYLASLHTKVLVTRLGDSLLFMSLLAVLVWALRRGWSVSRLFYGLLVLALAASFLHWV